MPIFSYKAKDQFDALHEGTVDAGSEYLASELLKEKGYEILKIDLQEGKAAVEFQFTFLQRVKPKDVVIFSRQLSVLVSASVHIVRALETTAKQTENQKLRRELMDVANEVDGGVRLSTALGKYPKSFGTFYINMVRSGETSGKLDEILLYLADQQEKDYDMRSKVKGAMIYPIFVTIMLFGVGAIMMIFVVPKLTAILQQSNIDLPFTTKALIATSDFFVNFWFLIIGAVVGTVFGVRYAHSTPAGKRFLDAFILRLPVFGNMFKKLAIVRITQSLSTLIAGGVDVVGSLKVVADIVGNEVYRQIILETIEKVGAGSTISSVWKDKKEFPTMVTQMVSVGEETGRLQDVLDRMTHFYTREVEALVANLSVAIEPIIMVVMGVAVGGMVSAIILPMYTLAQAM